MCDHRRCGRGLRRSPRGEGGGVSAEAGTKVGAVRGFDADVAVRADAVAAPVAATSRESGCRYRRHALPVRIMHWVNVLALTVMLASGLQIFNAYPALHFGKSSYNGVPPVLAIGARLSPASELVGMTWFFGRVFDTTGYLGAVHDDGQLVPSSFPPWMLLPGPQWLAMARAWHFFFAWIFVLNGLAYVAYSLWSRHLARDLAPTRGELAGIGASLADHLRFRRPRGEAAKRYNVVQKLAYLAVIFGLAPFTILMGFGLSPWLDSVVLTGWVDLVGGRQSARTLHFIAAWLLVGFALIHVFQMIVAGFWNKLRSMITGSYRITSDRSHA
jgi:thiosulfate reductase cytochrome b subunit